MSLDYEERKLGVAFMDQLKNIGRLQLQKLARGGIFFENTERA
jgi:hypothetical protein